ncbi:MAG: S8 family serine peptidase [Planctomycetes bacterium]|nr:S8 family serine peptidase [Planctomycetota bacterium]
MGFPHAEQKLSRTLWNQLAIAEETRFELWLSTFENDSESVLLHVPGSMRESILDAGVLRERSGAGIIERRLPDGWQRRALEEHGVVVIDHEPDVQAFRVLVDRSALSALLTLDFVAYLEPVMRAGGHHQESTPMIGSDYVRALYDGGTTRHAIAGMIDSGMQLTHEAFQNLHAVGWDFTGSAGGEWVDDCVHGTHVAGTILGDPPFPDTLARGNAHGLGFSETARFRSVKDVNGLCLTSGTSPGAIYGVLNGAYTDPLGNVSPKPHVVNASWGLETFGNPVFRGTELEARFVDLQVYTHEQMYVFSAGNTGPITGTIAREGSAKNALTVGYVIDFEESPTAPPGSVGHISSRGPCGDGRWKPNLTAPGGWICSALPSVAQPYGVPSPATSWAAPHVTGVAAQLVDQYASFAYKPHVLHSVLMATATPDGWRELGSLAGARSHLESRGVGCVDAFAASFAMPTHHWTNWDFTVSGQYAYADFDVPATASRVVVCMVYHESPSNPGAQQAVIKDLDLYIDAPPVDVAAGNTGDYTDHQSMVDNVEIRSFDVTPQQAGTWRFKVYPVDVPGTVKVSVTVYVIEAPVQCSGSLTLVPAKTHLQPGEQVDLLATCDNDAFLASQVFVDAWSNQGPNVQLHRAFSLLKDGVLADYLSPSCALGWAKAGWQVMLGDIAGPDQRELIWTLSHPSEGTFPFVVEASGVNWGPHVEQVTFVVDGTAPTGVQVTIDGGASTTDDANVSLLLSATDSLSGVFEMRLRNDGGSFSPWEPYATTRSWNLTDHGGSTAHGTRTVFLEVRDRSLNVSSGQASIYYHHPITSFGTACPGSIGQPMASVFGLPGFSGTLTFDVTNTMASLGVLVWGGSNTAWGPVSLPLDLSFLGVSGCRLLVSLDVLAYVGTPGAIPIFIPSDPALVDVPVFAQWLLFADPSGALVVTTIAHEVRISGA